jgi:hypothetical protein
MSYEVEVPFSDIGFSFDSSMGLDVSHVASGGNGMEVLLGGRDYNCQPCLFGVFLSKGCKTFG